MKLTPSVKKLIILKMAKEAVPKGGGLPAATAFLSDAEKIRMTMKGSVEWVEAAIRVIRSAPDPNPFKTATDEEIAAEIVRRIEEKRNGQAP